MNQIYNDDCFNVFPDIKDRSIDMVIVDLPYGQTACVWDIKIDLVKMWEELRRIAKDKCNFVFFTTTRFGVELINSKPKWFCYDLVWEKSNTVGYLCSNGMPLRKHEMIYIFNNSEENDLDNSRNLEMREYAKQVLKYINKPCAQIVKDFGNHKTSHFLEYATSTQFSLPTKETYNKLIELYGIDKMDGFLKFEEFKPFEKSQIKRTYNPQKTKGKPYIVKAHSYKNGNIGVYNQPSVKEHSNETGDRHPTSILKFNNPINTLHRTQKPLDLCEWLINTYSKEGDNVLDFCMGSGTSVVACINTKRKYIGVEKDEEIFKLAKERIEKSI